MKNEQLFLNALNVMIEETINDFGSNLEVEEVIAELNATGTLDCLLDMSFVNALGAINEEKLINEMIMQIEDIKKAIEMKE